MKKKWTRFVAALAALFLLISSAGAESALAGQTVVEDIRKWNGENAQVFTQNGFVTFVDGACTDQPVTGMEDAERVVASMIGLLGGDERTHFEPWRILTDPSGNVYYVFQQMYADTTVLGGAVKVITDGAGGMTGLTGSVVTELPDLEAYAGISAPEAEALALEHFLTLNQGRPELLAGMTRKIVLPVNRELDMEAEEEANGQFVWAVYTTNPAGGWNAEALPYLAHYVNMAGEYLYSLPTILPGDASAEAGYDAAYVFEFMEPVDYTGYVDLSDGTEREISVTLMRDTRTGMYYLGNIEHRIVVGDCWNFLYNHGRVVLEYSPDNLEWDQVGLLSLYNYCRAYDYYKEIGWEGADGQGTPIIVLNNFCDEEHQPVNNAAYVGKYYGWQCFLASAANDYSQCLDVCAHEFTHCVTNAVMTYNAYMNDQGAINEAMSDIQGNICEMLLGATEDETWTVGDRSATKIRSMSNPRAYSQPAYSWDLHYKASVRTPTPSNDQGGVHTNSSLLNSVAYKLWAEGGMTLEEARSYWFSVDCAMVPGSDYAQLRALLPWVLRQTGMERYQDALEKAMQDTRLGQDALPETIDPGYSLLTMNLPDMEEFSDGNWALNVFSVNVNRFFQLLNDLNNETLDQENKGSLLDWILENKEEFFSNSNGSAGQDGLTIHMMSRPGYALPVLLYLTQVPNSQRIKDCRILVYLDHQWINLTGVLAATPEEFELVDMILPMLASETFWRIVFDSFALAMGRLTPTEMMDHLFFKIPDGAACVVPDTGLAECDLTQNMGDLFNVDPIEIIHRTSRPKLPAEDAKP